MAQLPAIEVSCSYTVVDAAPLSPFAWAVLRTIKSFSPGARPHFELLSEKLRIGDRSFLDQGWEECVSGKLVTAKYDEPPSDLAERTHPFFGGGRKWHPLTFNDCQINTQGEHALTFGYIIHGNPVRRSGEALYFLLHDGAVVKWKDRFHVTPVSPAKKPKWADTLTPARIVEAIAAQSENLARHITNGKRIESLAIDWAESRQVSISTERSK